LAVLLAALPYIKCHKRAQHVLPALAQHQFPRYFKIKPIEVSFCFIERMAAQLRNVEQLYKIMWCCFFNSVFLISYHTKDIRKNKDNKRRRGNGGTHA
jgi:hypothetical protein